LNGHDLCVAITADNPCPPPVIFLSGRTLPKDRVLGLEAGAVDYMTKPFDAKELIARVAVALRTGRRMATLAHDASVDRMTGLLNRAQLDDRLCEAVARTIEVGANLGCVLIDLDHFKHVNDRFGHLVAIAAEPITGLDLTASAGVAVWLPGFSEPTELLDAADAALYEAKRTGRARVAVSALVGATTA
jgi:PleD family two-component response regulator